MPLPFKRIYVDIPSDAHATLRELAQAQKKPMNQYLAELIASAVKSANTKTEKRKRGKESE